MEEREKREKERNRDESGIEKGEKKERGKRRQS